MAMDEPELATMLLYLTSKIHVLASWRPGLASKRAVQASGRPELPSWPKDLS